MWQQLGMQCAVDLFFLYMCYLVFMWVCLYLSVAIHMRRSLCIDVSLHVKNTEYV